MKPLGKLFLEQKQSRGLGVHVREALRWPRGREARTPPLGAPPPSWAPRGSLDRLLSPIYTHIPRKHPGAPRNPIPPPQPSVPKRSHLGAFLGAPPEGESITKGFYINTIASPMMCEQFTSDLRVHSYQLDGFFSLFGSQYNFLLDLLGDLFDVTLFAVCLLRSNELWVYDHVYL